MLLCNLKLLYNKVLNLHFTLDNKDTCMFAYFCTDKGEMGTGVHWNVGLGNNNYLAAQVVFTPRAQSCHSFLLQVVYRPLIVVTDTQQTTKKDRHTLTQYLCFEH